MTQKRPEDALFELIKPLVNNEKVYALRAPDGENEQFVIYQKVDSERWRDVNGPSGMAQAYMQIDCYAPSFNEMKDLADSVETTLDGFRGTVYYGSDSPQDSIAIKGISLQNDLDLLDQEDDPVLFRNNATYLVTYEQ